MSTNIKVQRICQHCGKEFTARTTTTRYCSHRCNSKGYKAMVRAGKVEASNKETQRIISKPIEQLNAKEFLTVRDVAKLLNCSLRTTYRLIELGNIRAVNIAQRKTLVKRSDLDKLFEQPQVITQQVEQVAEPAISDCYTITEVQNKYGIAETTLQLLIKRNSVPKFKKGRFTHVPKNEIDSLLKDFKA